MPSAIMARRGVTMSIKVIAAIRSSCPLSKGSVRDVARTGGGGGNSPHRDGGRCSGFDRFMEDTSSGPTCSVICAALLNVSWRCYLNYIAARLLGLGIHTVIDDVNAIVVGVSGYERGIAICERL